MQAENRKHKSGKRQKSPALEWRLESPAFAKYKGGPAMGPACVYVVLTTVQSYTSILQLGCVYTVKKRWEER